MTMTTSEIAFMRSLGERLVRLRLEAGWTQKELSDRSGVSLRTIGKAENGETGLRLYNATRLADALGVPVRDLVSGVKGHADEHGI